MFSGVDSIYATLRTTVTRLDLLAATYIYNQDREKMDVPMRYHRSDILAYSHL